jgi:hypothetical protein
MKYYDKNTIKKAIKHEEKMAYDDSTTWTRMHKRYIKNRIKKFLQRVTKEDIYWWKSLKEDEKYQIVGNHFSTSISEIKTYYPGNIAIVRELKLNDLKI